MLSFATFGLWYATWKLVKGADRTAESHYARMSALSRYLCNLSFTTIILHDHYL